MSELHDLVLDAHGVTRWKSPGRSKAMSITGMFGLEKVDPMRKQVRVTADTALSRSAISRSPDWRSVYRPGRRDQDLGQQAIKSRANPRAAFEGHTVETAWDDLHLAYFSGYAIWNT
jgi:hypothetical protein